MQKSLSQGVDFIDARQLQNRGMAPHPLTERELKVKQGDDARRDLLAAQERLDRKRRKRKASASPCASTRSCKSRPPATVRLRRSLRMKSIRSYSAKATMVLSPSKSFCFNRGRLRRGELGLRMGLVRHGSFAVTFGAHPRFSSLAPAALIKKLRRLIDLEEDFWKRYWPRLRASDLQRDAGHWIKLARWQRNIL